MPRAAAVHLLLRGPSAPQSWQHLSHRGLCITLISISKTVQRQGTPSRTQQQTANRVARSGGFEPASGPTGSGWPAPQKPLSSDTLKKITMLFKGCQRHVTFPKASKDGRLQKQYQELIKGFLGRLPFGVEGLQSQGLLNKH